MKPSDWSGRSINLGWATYGTAIREEKSTESQYYVASDNEMNDLYN